jgi:hypothetical protein
MKRLKILLIVIVTQACSLSNTEIEKMAVRVPDTNTFSLQDVVNAVEDHAGDIPDNLSACFANSIVSYFDPDYDNNSYAVANSLKRFRNYGPDEGNYDPFCPDAFDPEADYPYELYRIHNLEYYPDHEVKIFAGPAFNAGGETIQPGDLLYHRVNDYHLYPWDGTYNGYDCPSSYGEYYKYTVVLTINGSIHTNKYFDLWRGIL